MDARPRRSTGSNRVVAGTCGVLIVVVLLAIYAPAVTAVYGELDDFPCFFPVDDHIRGIFLADARPTAAFFLEWAQPWVERLEDLRWIRGIALVALATACGLLFRATRRIFPDPLLRAAVCIGVGTLPAFTVYAAWATMWFAAVGIPVALAGAMIAWRGCRYAVVRRPVPTGVCWGISTLVTLLLFTLYQPLVTWFWVIGLSAVLDRRFLLRRNHRQRCARFLIVGLAQLVPCFLFMKLFFPLTGVVPKERVGLVTDPIDKLQFLARTLAPQVLALWQVIDVNRKPLMLAIAGASAVFILAGIVLVLCRTTAHNRLLWRTIEPHTRLLWLVSVGVCLVLSHLHGFAVAANVQNYRTAAALSAAIALLFFWSLGQIVLSPPVLGRYRATRPAASVMVVILTIAMARGNLVHYFTRPDARGYAYVVEQLEANLTPQTRQIHLIRQSPDDGIVTEKPFHSFGRPLTEVEWVMPGLAIAALRDAAPDRDPRQFELTHSLDPNEAPTDDGVLVIDMRELKRFRNP